MDPIHQYPTCVAFEDVFTLAELDRIIAQGDALVCAKAVLAGSDWKREEADRIRITRNAWMAQAPDTRWIYDRIFQVFALANQKAFQFDLKGFSEDFQYTVYDGSEGSHYDWHMDLAPRTLPRKLSMSLQLSDPADYAGCDLQFYASRQLELAPRTRGVAIVFPSYILHRVTPITAGTRKSLVVWAEGPKFK